ncbi:MAG: hypothetical protein U0Q21_10585 [Dermatophilaceae bacterium]
MVNRSWSTAGAPSTLVFGAAGLAAPAVVVAWLLRYQPQLRADVCRRLTDAALPHNKGATTSSA